MVFSVVSNIGFVAKFTGENHKRDFTRRGQGLPSYEVFFHKVLTFFEGWHCIVEFEVFVGKKINILEKID